MRMVSIDWLIEPYLIVVSTWVLLLSDDIIVTLGLSCYIGELTPFLLQS